MHLHAGDWDAFGAAFPGVPYFMMGFANEIAWGLTTGFVDSYDLFVEQMQQNNYRAHDGWREVEQRRESIAVKGAADKTVDIHSTQHGECCWSRYCSSWAWSMLCRRIIRPVCIGRCGMYLHRQGRWRCCLQLTGPKNLVNSCSSMMCVRW